MLPKFPEFKKLELSDRAEVEKIFLKFEPYSDFDFPSMWSWDVNSKIRISQIDGNLIAILSDHFSGDSFYTFLGDHEINKTLKLIFAFSEITENPVPILRAVPEVSLKDIDLKKYLLEIDLNNCDYVYNVEGLASYDGSKYSHKRKLYNRFVRNNPQAKVMKLDLNTKEVKTEIISLSRVWMKNKLGEDEGLDLDKELKAIERFLDAGFEEALGVGLMIGEKLIGYQLCTLLSNEYAICHFGKIDVTYRDAFEYMMSQNASILIEHGIKYLNTEEDLGLPNLRYSKDSYRPSSILRKYTIKEL